MPDEGRTAALLYNVQVPQLSAMPKLVAKAVTSTSASLHAHPKAYPLTQLAHLL